MRWISSSLTIAFRDLRPSPREGEGCATPCVAQGWGVSREARQKFVRNRRRPDAEFHLGAIESWHHPPPYPPPQGGRGREKHVSWDEGGAR